MPLQSHRNQLAQKSGRSSSAKMAAGSDAAFVFRVAFLVSIVLLLLLLLLFVGPSYAKGHELPENFLRILIAANSLVYSYT